MSDPGSTMSLTAILVLAAVVLVLVAVWLGAVFYAGRQPRENQENAVHRGDAGRLQAGPGESPDGTASHAG